MHFMGPGKDEVIAMLRERDPERHLPILLGRYEVQAKITREDGAWRLVAMVIDEERAAEEGRRRIAAGMNWMPEMRGAFLEDGETLATATTAAALADHLARTRYDFLLPP